ncbi:hypothetical protein [Parendozoicomonas sp. Alg238-R29]|uniref:hypothetical protein n=1 Tax=Parendozoicomonas sp. Alg238-R29 TaxID=2993446 RepID=UPI00248EEEA8|nr:hypothetical protein [Parendozoicomonas sp. Alg238-R29]
MSETSESGSLPTSTFLGEGFASDRLQTTGFSCLNTGEQHFEGAAATTINFGSQRSYDDVERALNINLSASASYDIFTGSAAVGFARAVRGSRLSESYYFVQQVLLPVLVYTPSGYSVDALNKVGSQAYAEGPDAFRHTCGDSFTRELHYGAGLFLAIKINFSSIFDRTAFDASANLKVASIFSILSSVESEAKDKHINGSIEVVAYQRGGEPRRLSNVFSKGEEGYHITSCNLDNTEACNNILSGIIDYASQDFSNQLLFTDGEINGHAYVVKRDFKPYDQLGLTVGASVVSTEVIAARRRLGKMFAEAKEQEEFIRQLLFSQVSPFLTLTSREQLDDAHNALKANIRLLSSPNHGVIRCYDSPKGCLETEAKIMNSLSPVDQTVIASFEQAFTFRNMANNPGYALPIGDSVYVYYYPYNDMPSLINTASIREEGETLKISGSDREFSISGVMNRVSRDYFSGKLTVNNQQNQYTYHYCPVKHKPAPDSPDSGVSRLPCYPADH